MTITPAEQVGQAALSGFAQNEGQIAELKRLLENRTRHRDKAEAYVVSLSQQLAESQAREARLREAIGKRIPERVIETLWQGAGISTYHPNGDQADKLHQFAASLIEEFRFRLPALPHDDTALKEYRDAVIEGCAVIASNSCLVPPDGGSPTLEEAAVSEEAARRIRKLKSTSVPAGYTEDELERDNPYNQWMHE